MDKSRPSLATSAFLPYMLYALTGFTGLLAEQGFEKYIALLVGATASASAIVIFAYFLGFALGSFAAGKLIQKGFVREPLRAYGLLEFLVGASCIAFTYGFHPAVAFLAPLQSLDAAQTEVFAIRFFFGTILILPTAALMGASFPLIAQVVDREDSSGGAQWAMAYGSNLAGALLACLAGAYWLIPAIGIRGAFWLCAAIGLFVWIVSRFAKSPATPPAPPVVDEVAHPRSEADPEVRIMLLAAFLSGLVFFSLEVLWTHLISTTLGGSVYAFSSMLIMVLLGLFWALGEFEEASRPRSLRFCRGCFSFPPSCWFASCAAGTGFKACSSFNFRNSSEIFGAWNFLSSAWRRS